MPIDNLPITTKPFSLDNLELGLKVAGDTAVVNPIQYRCQLGRSELVPSASTGGGNELVTFCETHTSPTGKASWTLELEGFQAWSDISDLSLMLFNNEGETLDFILVPSGGLVGPSNPAFTGQCLAVPTPVGGTAGSYATFTVSLPCLGKPVIAVTFAAAESAYYGRQVSDEEAARQLSEGEYAA